MNKIGIVCEYNPFHLGHLHQIQETKRHFGNDSVIICTMSGDFVQRGEAAAFTKHARAEAACRCGADIVFELPLPWSISSAENFASGAVDILAAAGCTYISFGSESGDIDKLCALAKYAASENVRQNVKALYKCSAALPYAKVRQLAIEREVGSDAELLSQPNNILAVEYIKAIYNKKLNMEPFTVKRIGNSHDSSGEDGPMSASELRKMLDNGDRIYEHIPAEAASVYERELEAGRVRNKEIIDIALMSRIIALSEDEFESLPDGAGGAGRRLYKTAQEYSGIENIAYHAATRPYPMARMRRMLMCAALGITTEYTKHSPPYMRVLALNAKGREYLRELNETSIPIVIKPATVRALGAVAESVFAKGALANDVFRLQFVANDDKKPGEDWRKGPVIVQN